jgi:hypothetical protein
MKHHEKNRQETKHEQVIIHGPAFRGNIISTTFKEFICADFLPPCTNIWINLVMEWMLSQMEVDSRATDKSKPLPKCCETMYEQYLQNCSYYLQAIPDILQCTVKSLYTF